MRGSNLPLFEKKEWKKEWEEKEGLSQLDGIETGKKMHHEHDRTALLIELKEKKRFIKRWSGRN